MEWFKFAETYTFNDTHPDGWYFNGDATKYESGNIMIAGTIKSAEGDWLGQFIYDKPLDKDVNITYDVEEEYRELLIEYANTVVDFVYEHI